MGKVTRVSNETDAVIELKQGSANVFHFLHSLPPKKFYDINVDESATYREYWCAVQPGQSSGATAERVVFSSDDCAEFSKVKIYKDKNNKYTWEGTENRGTWRNTPVTTPGTTPGTTSVPTEGTTPGTTSVPTEGTTPVTTSGPSEGTTPSTTPVRDAGTHTWGQKINRFFRKKN